MNQVCVVRIRFRGYEEEVKVYCNEKDDEEIITTQAFNQSKANFNNSLPWHLWQFAQATILSRRRESEEYEEEDDL